MTAAEATPKPDHLRDPFTVARRGGTVAEIVRAMDPDYVDEWPQAAHDWAVRLLLEYVPNRPS